MFTKQNFSINISAVANFEQTDVGNNILRKALMCSENTNYIFLSHPENIQF